MPVSSFSGLNSIEYVAPDWTVEPLRLDAFVAETLQYNRLLFFEPRKHPSYGYYRAHLRVIKGKGFALATPALDYSLHSLCLQSRGMIPLYAQSLDTICVQSTRR